MLIAIYFALMSLFGGGGEFLFGQAWLDAGAKQIKAGIHEPARRDLAMQEFARLEKDLQAMKEQVARDTEELNKLTKDYTSTPEAFDRLIDAARANRQRETAALIDGREALLKHIQPDEWRAVAQGVQQAE